jgi:adenylate cyclase
MVRKIRLTTGLILFVYVTCHLLNHALGLVSLQAMDEMRRVLQEVWRSLPGTAALYASLIAHLLLAGYALYARRSLRMSVGEAFQLVLGFSIPLFLALHFAGTRGAFELADTRTTYAFVLLSLWKYAPTEVYWQSAGLFAAWIHGCIGIYMWLRLKPGFGAWQSTAFGLAVLVPVLAWLGFYTAGKEALALAENRDWLEDTLRFIRPPDREQLGLITDITDIIRLTVVSIVGLALLGRAIRAVGERQRGSIRISYPESRTVRIAPGVSVLEASRLNGIPHASVCGGRGRCSTCRIQIAAGSENVPEPSDDEIRVLERVGAPARVRLACQTVPTGDISVVPLMPPNASVQDIRRRSRDLEGQERDVAILFADLRSFTQFSEKKLPYDVVFVLNRYFAQMGTAVESAGGHLDKFIGDGVMALFGTQSDLQTGARQALDGARMMSAKLAELNEQLGAELDEPLRIGIGIHAGPAIIGEMGYGNATGLTAIGDSVNTASRLETMTKEFGAQLIFSEDVARPAGIDTVPFDVHDDEVRGRAEPVKVFVVKDASTLSF